MHRLLAALLWLLPLGAHAAESAAFRSSHATVTLVSDTDAVQSGRPLHLGLRFRLAPGWHIYWQNPGDAGIAPELALTLPAGAAAGQIEWPTPERLPEGPVMTYSYRGDITLPLRVTPGSGPLEVTAKADWLVCDKVCVPEEGSFQLSLPPGQPAPSAEAPLFAAAAQRTPVPSPFAASVAPDATLALAGDGLSPLTVREAWFFPDAAGAIDQAAPQPLAVSPGLVRLRLRPGESFDPKAVLSGVVVLKDKAGQESFLHVSAAPGAPGDAAPGILRLLGLALLGGLLLNLMPCVFPILAMKAVAIARLSGAGRNAVRAHAASYTAGVVAAFAALGTGLLLLRGAGEAAGWGFQFQSPVFVAVMAWLLFLVGLNLSGVFDVGGRLAGAGQGHAGRGGHAGSFFTGLLAVVVATPCTAPFMGAAIAGALAAPAWLTVCVFVAMGLGLALPYALLAAVPRLAGLLPRPGRWMDVLRGVLAFPVYGAALWLLWVLSQQAGPDGVLAGGAGLLLTGFAAWSFGTAQAAGRTGRRVGLLAAAAALLALASLVGPLRTAGPATTASAGPVAEPFSSTRLAALRAEGRPVFVDMTAAWCVTCLVNERIALAPQAVQDAFARDRVAYLKGDWTRQDAAITAFLREHGRDGVPLYVYYPPGGQPAVLPQILTASTVLDRIKPGT